GQHSGEANGAVHAYGAKGVGQRARSDEFERGVGAVGKDLTDRVSDVPVVDDRVIHASLCEFGSAFGAAGGGEHGGAEILGERGGGPTDRRGATADEQRLAGAQVEPGRERTVG